MVRTLHKGVSSKRSPAALEGGDDWKVTIRVQLRLESSLDESLRGIWSRNQELAKLHNQPLHPIEFAKMIVDQNFASLIG